MRRRRRAESGSRGRDAGGCGSLMYYLDAHEESRGESDGGARPCALVHNVVGTAKIAVTPGPLDLRLVNTLLPNSCFVKKKFAAITVRLREPTCTILLFGSGKCVLTGCRDFVSCIRAVYDVLDMLRKSMHGVHFGVETIQMQNIVGHADLELKGQHVDLGRFYADHNIECTFQRSMFPERFIFLLRFYIMLFDCCSWHVILAFDLCSCDLCYRGSYTDRVKATLCCLYSGAVGSC